MSIDLRLEELLSTTRASRVTLRQGWDGDYAFPVTNEVRLPGVRSLKGERSIDLRSQPVVLELQQGRQIVQDDCRAAFDDSAFQSMLEAYGGLAAQIVTPIFREGELLAIVSLHQLGAPRHWSVAEVKAATRAAAQVEALL